MFNRITTLGGLVLAHLGEKKQQQQQIFVLSQGKPVFGFRKMAFFNQNLIKLRSRGSQSDVNFSANGLNISIDHQFFFQGLADQYRTKLEELN